MKAKYYIKKYKLELQELKAEENNSLFAKKLKELLDEYVLEIDLMMKKRNSENNQVLVGVLNELDYKWKSISSKIPLISPTGFRNYLKLISPDTLKIMNWNI